MANNQRNGFMCLGFAERIRYLRTEKKKQYKSGSTPFNYNSVVIVLKSLPLFRRLFSCGSSELNNWISSVNYFLKNFFSVLSGHAFPSVTTSHAHTTRVWPNLVSERNDAGMLALIRGCAIDQRDPLPCFFWKNNLGYMLKRNQNGNDEEQCVLIMCCMWLFAWKDYFRSDEWKEYRKTNTLSTTNIWRLEHLRLEVSACVLFSAVYIWKLRPCFALFLSFFSLLPRRRAEKKNRRKNLSFLPVTLDDILKILAYTYCFTKPQNNKVLFKTPALNKAIKLEIDLLGIRLDDRSTYHFNLGSFCFEMRHSIQSLSHSSCFYRVSKTHFHFSFSASCQRNKFGVARSSIFARNLF